MPSVCQQLYLAHRNAHTGLSYKHLKEVHWAESIGIYCLNFFACWLKKNTLTKAVWGRKIFFFLIIQECILSVQVAKVAGHTASVTGKQKVMDAVLSSFSLFYTVQDPGPGMIPHTVGWSWYLHLNTIKIIPHRPRGPPSRWPELLSNWQLIPTITSVILAPRRRKQKDHETRRRQRDWQAVNLILTFPWQ